MESVDASNPRGRTCFFSSSNFQAPSGKTASKFKPELEISVPPGGDGGGGQGDLKILLRAVLEQDANLL